MDEQIKQLRKSLGMSQEKFAKEIGLTKNFISLVETGQRNLSTSRSNLFVDCLMLIRNGSRPEKAKCSFKRQRMKR